MDWLTVAIQAGGAVGVCGMFLWYLREKDKQQKHLIETHQAQTTEQMSYLRERDKQSREVAKEGYEALHTLADEIRELRTDMKSKT